MDNSIWVFISSLLCIVIVSSKSCLALYEDQVGIMDWHQQYIGNVKDAVFHTQKAGRKRVIVATEENVIASLDLRKGEIFWRHVLAETDAVDGIDIAFGKYVITLSSKGSILRAWNLPDGQMVWESHLKVSVPSKSLLSMPVTVKVEKDNAILAFSGGWLHAVSSVDGEILWTTELFWDEIQQIFVLPNGETVIAVGFVGGSSQLVLFQISTRNGEIIKQSTGSFPGGFFGEASFVSSDKLVVLDATRSTIVSAGFSDGKISFDQTPLSDLVEGHSADLTILPVKLAGMFALKTESSIFLVKVTNGDKLVIIDKANGPACVSDSLLLGEGQQAFAIVRQEDDKVFLRVKLDGGEQTELVKDNIQIDRQKGLVQKVFINDYIRKDRTYGFRALITMEDHSVLLLQQGEVVWSREDGLASIMDTTTSELPVEKHGVSVAKVEQNLFEWLKGHMLKLKGTLMLASPEDIAVIQDMRLRSSEKSKMTRDHNGFRKLIMVVTKAGKVFALHSGDGRIVWSLLLPSLRKAKGCQNLSGFKIYNWQVPHHHAMDTNPSILVVGRCGPDTSSVLSFVDCYTGKEIKFLNLPYSIVQVIPLPLTDSTEQRLHLLIDANRQAHLFPSSTDSLNKFKGEWQNIYFYSVDSERQIIMGHTLGSNCISDVADEYCFNTRQLWSVMFPSETEVIARTAIRKPNEAVHTQAKILGDQDVMYKYISKNLLFVATVSPKASGTIGSSTPDEAWLVAYLIDTVTGRILHRVTHLGAQGPINAVFSENWVVYHYFNLRAHRYEISVMEIYDESRADNKDVLRLMFGKHNLTAPLSSYSRPEVTVKAQSYFFTHSVKTLAVTTTVKGITSKQILIGTISDQVLALDKRFLDPRRTLDPSPSEREEGIIPLTDALPIIPQSYITHSLQVEGLRGIVTIPSRLESTALVFTYGVDLFFTRIAPSRTYDSLTEDFNYALLLITIVALVAAIIATWVLSEKKELRDKWRCTLA